MQKNLVFTIILFFTFILGFTQNQVGFQFENPNQRAVKIRFNKINNLILLPVMFNGVELTFLLDTGIDKTLLFVLEATKNLEINSSKTINIRGLGEDDKLKAYQAVNNTFKISEVVNYNKDVYIIVDEESKLTKRIGLPINGIIGSNFFENFIVKIDYRRNFIKLYNPERFNRKLASFESLPLNFYKAKPYIGVKVEDKSITKNKLRLLFDTGSGSSFWLLENKSIAVPKLYFNDILGYGFTSAIKGKRSKIDRVNLGDYEVKSPSVAYPDVSTIMQIEQNVMRDGTIGAEILRRFKWFLDYKNKKVYFKSNSSLNEPFNYDMSGLLLEYEGLKLIKRIKDIQMNRNNSSNFNEEMQKKNNNDFMLSVELHPKIVVSDVRPNSPAQAAEILPGDELIKINNRFTYKLKLRDIKNMLSEEDGKKIKLEFKRGEEVIKKEIYLRDRFKELLQNSKN